MSGSCYLFLRLPGKAEAILEGAVKASTFALLVRVGRGVTAGWTVARMSASSRRAVWILVAGRWSIGGSYNNSAVTERVFRRCSRVTPYRARSPAC
jgi:hypothetical protein